MKKPKGTRSPALGLWPDLDFELLEHNATVQRYRVNFYKPYHSVEPTCDEDPARSAAIDEIVKRVFKH